MATTPIPSCRLATVVGGMGPFGRLVNGFWFGRSAHLYDSMGEARWAAVIHGLKTGITAAFRRNDYKASAGAYYRATGEWGDLPSKWNP
jgi:hypothetical protein